MRILVGTDIDVLEAPPSTIDANLWDGYAFNGEFRRVCDSELCPEFIQSTLGIRLLKLFLLANFIRRLRSTGDYQNSDPCGAGTARVRVDSSSLLPAHLSDLTVGLCEG